MDREDGPASDARVHHQGYQLLASLVNFAVHHRDVELRLGRQLLDRVAQEVGFPARGLHAGAMLGQRRAGDPDGLGRLRDRVERAAQAAEGVEDVDTLQVLRRSGCDSAQGYLFAKALTSPDMERWLGQWDAVAGTIVPGALGRDAA